MPAKSSERTTVLGLTGGMAAGKTTVARAFQRLGVPVFNADAVVRKLQGRGGAAIPALQQLRPSVISNGCVDRAALRAELAKDPGLLKKLEVILHPLVRKERQVFLRQCRARGVPLCVLDVPLLWESGAAASCDLVLVVEAALSTRLARVKHRHLLGGRMTVALARQLMACQMNDEERRARADLIFSTEGRPAGVQRQVRRLAWALRGGRSALRQDRDCSSRRRAPGRRTIMEELGAHDAHHTF
ncbi:dephospho-CoA kinase [Oecophyllibacter saccharovorans]|uniref:dephospho-CoA kinase n=1 Tax=Oecophyllibacter saccharovorans TaxID=2558360 RepID=UPI001F50354D|nr:dephospho-CoA kinase [Oecophyllibacter saccharovorans]